MQSIQKSVTALVSGSIGWGFVVVASPAAAISASEWLMLAVVAATALGVYSVPNAPKDQTGAADAGLTLLESLVLLLVVLAFAFAGHSAGWW